MRLVASSETSVARYRTPRGNATGAWRLPRNGPRRRIKHSASCERPLPPTGPLAVGDPVEAPSLGVRGTIAGIDGEEAEVIGTRGQRIRIALSRLRPDVHGERPGDPPQPSVQVLASARSDVSDELDVRGTRAQEAREAVRAFVDDAALAGLPQVRVVHGRGTGALRTAVREELDRHPLVERREAESADGATVAHLAPGRYA